ncbi:MAG: glucosamine-6-phosphate deaminase [Ruminococcaceae bacterium]|nr:glucosamine-6-phosphate deaminase [Oscillospiraceae bacterium]MBQ7312821.1 6-phosphogluconolactonase [Clostridia bacterium]
MKIQIHADASANGAAAAEFIAQKISEAIAAQGYARICVSTGASQFEMFRTLVTLDVDWSKVEMFHLDEYIGMPVTHVASFRKYLTERFIERLPVGLKAAYLVNGEGDVEANIAYLTEKINEAPIDVGIIGIGENGHIAFNDPPADFDTDAAYHVVNLDERCRKQQLGEGWFENLDAVPKQAISMTVKEILKAKCIVSVVPHAVKAEAVFNTMQKPLTNRVPATALKTHPDWNLFLDYNSAKLICDTTGC